MSADDETFDDDYSSDSVSLESETKPFDVIIADAIDGRLLDLHTALPAQIVKVRGNNLVDIQPLLQRKYKDGTLHNLPVIQNVPVYMPSGKDYWLKLPIASGDVGMAIFSERSLDIWNVSGGIVDPQDPRTHSLSDAVFYPGIRPSSDQIQGASNDMVIHNGNAEVVVQKPGQFKMQKVGGDEVLDLIVQITDKLDKALYELGFIMTTNTIFGAMQPNNFLNFRNLQTQVDALKTRLTALKGS